MAHMMQICRDSTHGVRWRPNSALEGGRCLRAVDWQMHADLAAHAADLAGVQCTCITLKCLASGGKRI